MRRISLFKKYYKNENHDYEITETITPEDDTGRHPDICFVYSGRNRGKSYEISSQAIADAWFDKKLFGYVRRHDCTAYEVERYFADKDSFVNDMTDGEWAGITKNKGEICFYRYETNEKTGNTKRVFGPKCGYFFALSRQASFKSQQFPDLYNLIYEEVLTTENYLQAEPEILLNLISTTNRSKTGFRAWLISNTVSIVNPYSAAWGLNLLKIKPGEIGLTKLYLNAADKNGKEKYYLIATHYLCDKDKLPEEESKAKRNRVKSAISSNTWDELTLYPHLPLRMVKPYKPIETVLFEYDDLIFQGDILEIPNNLFTYYRENTEENPVELSADTMPVLFIRRKTSEPKQRTRIYTNNTHERFSEYTTKGFRVFYGIDRIIENLIDRGWIVGSDNLTMNDFSRVYESLANEI